MPYRVQPRSNPIFIRVLSRPHAPARAMLPPELSRFVCHSRCNDGPSERNPTHALHRHRDRRRGPRRLDRRGNAGTRGDPCDLDRSASDLIPPSFAAKNSPARAARICCARPVSQDATLHATTLRRANWEARFGYLVAKRPIDQHGIMYDALINAFARKFRPASNGICAKPPSISTSGERQKRLCQYGEEISARLVVLANGLNVGLRRHARHQRQFISECHSITLGFDVGRSVALSFDFPALDLFRRSDRVTVRPTYRISDR